MKPRIGNETNHLELQINALLTEYTNVYQEFLSNCRIGMQAMVLCVTGIILLMGYVITRGEYQILLVIPPFITLFGAFILYMSLAQADKRALLTILEKRINILTSGDIDSPLLANDAIFSGEFCGDSKKYPYLAPLHEYTKFSLYSVFIIGFFFYALCLIEGILWLFNQDFMIGSLVFPGKIIALVYLLIFIIVPTLLIKWTLKSLTEINKGTISEINRLSNLQNRNSKLKI